MTPQKQPASEQRRALQMLNDATSGCWEEFLLSQITIEMLAGLIGDGLVTAQLQNVDADGREIQVVRMDIRDEGRKALEGPPKKSE